MHEFAILRDLVLLLAAALPIVLLFQRLNLPTVVGFLSTGIVIGPHGLGLISQTADVESLAEIGLVLLLFVVGLELSFRELARMGRVIVWAGTLQVGLTAALGTALAVLFGADTAEAVFLGFLVVHSSTAIVLKVFSDRGEVDAPHGRLASGILLIQDLSLVPMVLLTRVLAPGEAASWSTVLLVMAKAAAAVALLVVAARLLMPALLRRIVGLRSRELFTGAVVLCCLGTAWLASQFGLSLALGALLAGLVISESEYSHQVVADMVPFRDTFNSVFFISVGMLVRVDVLWAHLPLLLGGAVALMAFKALVTAACILPVYRSLRVVGTTALSLAQVGELAFVLAQFALPSGLLSAERFEIVVTLAVVTMVATPFVMAVAGPLSAALERRLRRDGGAPTAPAAAPRSTVLIAGYGLNGRHLAEVLKETGLAYTILDLNPDRVAAARVRGESVVFGDATRPAVLEQAGVAAAQVIVVAISDPVATRRIVALARGANRDASIIVRTRAVAEIDELRALGATEVIPEEYETSVEIFARVLRRLRVPRNVIALQVDLVRRAGYGMLRGLQLPRQTLDQLDHILAVTTTETFLVRDAAPAAGLSIRALALRKETGVTIIAVVRGGTPTTNPPPEFVISAGDILVLLGNHAQLDHALRVLGAERDGDEDPA